MGPLYPALAALFLAAVDASSSPVCPVPDITANTSVEERCSFTVDKALYTYTPPAYEANWEVLQASSYTAAPFPNFMELMKDMGGALQNEYVMQLVTMTGVVTGIITFLLFGFCYFCCCRRKCCPCCKCPKKMKPMFARFGMIIVYGGVIVVGLTGFSGQNLINSSIDTFEEGVDMISASINGLSSELKLEYDEVVCAVPHAEAMRDGACDIAYPTDPDERAAFEDAIDGINQGLRSGGYDMVVTLEDNMNNTKDALDEIVELESTFNDVVYAGIDQVKLLWNSYVSPATLAFGLLFVALGGMGMLGSFVPKCYIPHLGISWCIMFLLMILLAIVFLVGVLLSDVCTPSPLDNILSMLQDQSADLQAGATDGLSSATGGAGGNSTGASEEEGDFLGYYISCVGKNPLEAVTDNLFSTIAITFTDACNLVDQARNESFTFSANVGGFDVSRTFYKVDADACKTAIGGIQLATTGMFGHMQNIVASMLTCQFVNEPLALMLETGMCNQFAGGMFSMWVSLFTGCIAMLTAMYVNLPMWDVMEPPKDKKAKKGAKKGGKRGGKKNQVVPDNAEAVTGGVAAVAINDNAYAAPEQPRHKGEDPFNPGNTNPLDKAPLPVIQPNQLAAVDEA